ncbi:Protein bric-a-brac 2, partial [Operophtera brumata]
MSSHVEESIVITSVIGALGRMLSTGALTDVTLSAGGTSVKAHKLVLASCSQYFAQLFKEVEAENNTMVVVLSCEMAELRLLLTFMYTGEVTASKKALPTLLRLAQTLRNSTLTPTEAEPQDEQTNSPINLDVKNEPTTPLNDNSNSSKLYDEILSPNLDSYDFAVKSEKDRLSKLDQIVQNLYSTHKIVNPTIAAPLPNVEQPSPYDKKYRPANSICSVCNKVLSNQYNLRVHMETHAGRRHACRACGHVSRSRDALRKH